MATRGQTRAKAICRLLSPWRRRRCGTSAPAPSGERVMEVASALADRHQDQRREVAPIVQGAANTGAG